jgi:biopolymer transport protein ExbB/TolQ
MEKIFMNRIKKLLGVFIFALLLLSLPSLASAQRRDDNRDNGFYNAAQLKNAINRLRNDSRDFAKFVDRDLDKSQYNGRNREDNLNQLAKDFRDAASRLASRFGNGRNWNNASSEAQNVIRLGNRVDRAMKRVQLSQNVEDYWQNIDNQLEEISRAYNRRSGWRS